jgi:hypothetical protein
MPQRIDCRPAVYVVWRAASTPRAPRPDRRSDCSLRRPRHTSCRARSTDRSSRRRLRYRRCRYRPSSCRDRRTRREAEAFSSWSCAKEDIARGFLLVIFLFRDDAGGPRANGTLDIDAGDHPRPPVVATRQARHPEEREGTRGPDRAGPGGCPEGVAQEEAESRARRTESPREQYRQGEVPQLANHQKRDEERAQEVRPQAHDVLSGRPTYVRLTIVLSGNSIYRLEEIMGHSSVQVTERYAHLTNQLTDAELARADVRLAS